MVILKCYNITFYSFTLHNFLYMRGRRYKILRNEDLGYNCGRKNYFVIWWKTTKETLYFRILLMDIDFDLVYLLPSLHIQL